MFEVGIGIVSNWDVMEYVLDYIFIKFGMNGVEGGIDMFIVMMEVVVNFLYLRKCLCFFFFYFDIVVVLIFFSYG